MCRPTRVTASVLYFFFLFMENVVICEVTVKAYINDDVLLPCHHSEVSQLNVNTSIYWMDKDDEVLAKISRTGFSTDDNIYKDRVKYVSESFNTGNFSIMLKNVQPSDNNKYYCAIPSAYARQTVFLNVSGERTEAEGAIPGPSGGAVVISVPLHITLLSLLFSCSE